MEAAKNKKKGIIHVHTARFWCSGGHMDVNDTLFSYSLQPHHPNIDFYIVPEKLLLLPADSNALLNFLLLVTAV